MFTTILAVAMCSQSLRISVTGLAKNCKIVITDILPWNSHCPKRKMLKGFIFWQINFKKTSQVSKDNCRIKKFLLNLESMYYEET
jgi:hypothetical protein